MSDLGSVDHKPKRFYKAATVEPLGESWTIALDGRSLKTPARKDLALPTKQLADLVCEEWNAQAEVIDAARMHATRLVNVAIDRTPEARDEMAEEVVRYAETDLLSHLAEAPDSLRARQDEAWTPVRDWAGEKLGVMLVPVEGIMASPQPSQSLNAAKEHALGLDDFRLTGLNFGLGLLGSALLSLALEQARLTADQAFEASRIDELYQIENWGEDEEAAERAAEHQEQCRVLAQYFEALAV